ncbi:MAG TPA: FAD-dependent oxidoreductase, partial [Betaproteobacteria bacterium]|nr:FAD-dependent oxidoreductase [Betaproteobacteria bacterium]
MLPIVIIGSGLAGYTVARELRKRDRTAPVMLITADDGRVYAKPMLSNALAAGKTAAALATADRDEMQRQLHIDIRHGSRVAAIDPLAHTLMAGGESIGYSKLVLALGADSVAPQVAGSGAADILTVNDLADYERFRAAIHPGQRIAILGAGLIGCEFANDLCGAGYPVALIHPAATPLNRLLPEAAGRAMREALTAAGVDWHGGEKAAAVDHAPGGYRLTLSGGAVVEAGAVLSAIGLTPRIVLAEAAGIRTRRGVVVDRYLQTSAADVYAVGDCAEVAGRVRPFVL